MSSLLSEMWELKPKHSSNEALQRWRDLCGVVKNRKRRFRFTANLISRRRAAQMRKTIQEKTKIARLDSYAALNFIKVEKSRDYTIPKKVEAARFKIHADELGSIVEGHNLRSLEFHGGVSGILDKLATDGSYGISTTDKEALSRRKWMYGINMLDENQARSFQAFVWEALHDDSLVTPSVCALVSLVAGTLTEGWPKGGHQGIGVAASILLVVFVTATRDYRCHLRDLDEKKKVSIQVTRDGRLQKMPVHQLLVGDIVQLAVGDRVPADGLFISGFPSMMVDTQESGPVIVSAEKPFLLSGSTVKDGGTCKMLVTAVGLRSRWGKLAVASGGGKSQPVTATEFAAIMGKLGVAFIVVSGEILVQRLIGWKWQAGNSLVWAGYGGLELLESIAMAAVPEGLPLAVTLSLVFAMKKVMNNNALLRHLAAPM